MKTVIEFLTMEKIRPIKIHTHLKTVYGDNIADVSNNIGSDT